MGKNYESLTPSEFYEKLQQGELDKPQPFIIIGMVKKSETEEKAIQFAPGGNCSNWITIPLEFIEDVEMIKTITCKDHTHPLVKLSVKRPETPEGKIFFAILEAMKQGSERTPSHGGSQGRGGSVSGIRARQGGGFGIDIGNMLGNLWGDCRVLEYQCHCVEWEHVGFGVDVCVRQECEFVCTERP